jgi:hypothetical protein
MKNNESENSQEMINLPSKLDIMLEGAKNELETVNVEEVSMLIQNYNIANTSQLDIIKPLEMLDSVTTPNETFMENNKAPKMSSFTGSKKSLLITTENGSNRSKDDEKADYLTKIIEQIEISQTKSKIQDLLVSKEEAYINFNAKICFLIFLYHLLFVTIGPLANIIIIPIEGRHFVRKMGFYGFSIGFFMQTLTFLGFGPNIILTVFFKYFVLTDKLQYGSYSSLPCLEISEMIFAVLAILIRIIIVSVRYGYTSEDALSKRYQPVYSNQEREYVLTGWRKANYDTIESEIKLSMVRLKLDVELFTFQVFSYLTEEWVNRLSKDDFYKTLSDKEINNIPDLREDDKKLKKKLNIKQINMQIYAQIKPFFNRIRKEKALKLFKEGLRKSISKINENIIENEIKKSKTTEHSSYQILIKRLAQKFNGMLGISTEHFNKKDDETNIPHYLKKPDIDIQVIKFPGLIFLREMIFGSKFTINNLFLYIMLILIVIHSFTACFYRAAIDKPAFGVNALETFLIINNIQILLGVFTISFLFIEVGGNDYARKESLMRYLSSMISPDKLTVEKENRLIPTINFMCPLNLQSWMDLRRLALDVGKRYMKRIEIYSSIILFCYGLIFIIIMLGNFKIITNFNYDKYPLFYLLGYIETFLMIIVLYRMVVNGVKIKNYVTTHLSQLSFIKTSFIYVIENFDEWKHMTTYVNPYLDCIKLFYCYSRERQRLITLNRNSKLSYVRELLCHPYVNMLNNDEGFKKHLSLCVVSIERAMERIKFEDKHNPLELLGLKLTPELLSQFYVSLLTMTYSLVQYFTTENKQ